jgi:D-beta-D-heptose 7-phosphate kinase/D-beta-D-heptose 1-phosphate adenosyltransferase
MKIITRRTSSFYKVKQILKDLKREQIASVVYHDIFDFPLNSAELYKWKTGKEAIKNIKHKTPGIEYKRGYFYLRSRDKLISKRLVRDKISEEKMKLARKYGLIIKYIPSVKMVAITGALAMGNASEDSDIDLMIITSKRALWTTRLIIWSLLKTLGFPLRRPGDKHEKDKLCLNIWLDESDLLWQKKDRNIFTAHEIAQIVPLVNKDNSYESFISKNKWVGDYWPNAVSISSKKQVSGSIKNNSIQIHEEESYP